MWKKKIFPYEVKHKFWDVKTVVKEQNHTHEIKSTMKKAWNIPWDRQWEWNKDVKIKERETEKNRDREGNRETKWMSEFSRSRKLTEIESNWCSNFKFAAQTIVWIRRDFENPKKSLGWYVEIYTEWISHSEK